MYLVIVGCGKLGSTIANLFSREKHNLVVIDRDSSAFHQLNPLFNGITILGNGIDVDIQRKAGADRADAFVVVSGNDATNLMAAQVARSVYHVPKIVARVSDTENEELYRLFGIKTISPTDWEVKEIHHLIAATPFQRYCLWERDKLELTRTRVRHRAVGKTVGELSTPGQLVIGMVIRSDGALIPEPDTLIQENDEVIVAMARDYSGKQRKWLEI